MKRSQWIPSGAMALAMLALAAVPAAAQTFAAGDDAFNTVGSGSTTVDVSQFPGALAALGSPIVGGNVINLQGVSLNSAFGPSVDSIVARGAIASGSGSLTLAALNMASASNLLLQDGRQYSMAVCLSDTAPSNGTISLTTTSGDGGTFNSSFNVIPKLVFTNVNNHNDVITIDCGAANCNLNISSTGSGYANTGGPNNFSPSAEGINSLPTGNQTVANCSGTHTVNILAPGGFYPGWSFSSGGNGPNGAFQATGVVDASRQRPSASSGGTFKPVGLNDNHAGAIHGTKPPQDCYRGGTLPSDAGRAGATPQLSVRYCIAQTQFSQQ
jgi:hypothetical protein